MSGRAARYPELVVATSNAGKLLEIRAVLGDLPVSLRALGAFPEAQMPEEGDDYAENAIGKARAVAHATGRPALADDSGLEVDGLGGRPGPHSARYGGPELDDAGRVEHLLRELAGLPEEDRRARFVCVVAIATPEGHVETARGECPGRILAAPRGRGGFGYDPVFEANGTGVSMAELAPARKNELSHRGRALRALRPALETLGLAGGRSRTPAGGRKRATAVGSDSDPVSGTPETHAKGVGEN